MGFTEGTHSSDMWFGIEEGSYFNHTRQLEFESKMISVAFRVGGSLYYARDLKVAGRPSIPLVGDERFCVGPDTRLSLVQQEITARRRSRTM